MNDTEARHLKQRHFIGHNASLVLNLILISSPQDHLDQDAERNTV